MVKPETHTLITAIRRVNARHALFDPARHGDVAKIFATLWHEDDPVSAVWHHNTKLVTGMLAIPFEGLDRFAAFAADLRACIALEELQITALTIRFTARIDRPCRIISAGCKTAGRLEGATLTMSDLWHFPLAGCDRPFCHCRFDCPDHN